jgi:hypothetical protein
MLRRVSLLAVLGSYLSVCVAALGEDQRQRTAVVLAAAVVTMAMAAERAAACTSATRKRAATFVAIDEERRQKRRRKRKKRPLVHPGPGVWDDYAPLFDAGHDSLAAPPPGCALRLAPCALQAPCAQPCALRLFGGCFSTIVFGV